MVVERVVRSLAELDVIISRLIDAGFENLGSWEFYNGSMGMRVHLILKLDY